MLAAVRGCEAGSQWQFHLDWHPGLYSGATGARDGFQALLTWQKAHKVPKGKDGSRLRASELMPRYAELWRLKKHDGRSDAALIALYALTHGGAE